MVLKINMISIRLDHPPTYPRTLNLLYQCFIDEFGNQLPTEECVHRFQWLTSPTAACRSVVACSKLAILRILVKTGQSTLYLATTVKY